MNLIDYIWNTLVNDWSFFVIYFIVSIIARIIGSFVFEFNTSLYNLRKFLMNIKCIINPQFKEMVDLVETILKFIRNYEYHDDNDKRSIHYKVRQIRYDLLAYREYTEEDKLFLQKLLLELL
jgi:hypothetical protein